MRIHHINGDGKEERKDYKQDFDLFYEDIVDGWHGTDVLQVLCLLCHGVVHGNEQYDSYKIVEAWR